MPTVVFTPNLRRHLEVADVEVSGNSVRGVLDAVFARNPRLRAYILDDQGALRRHVAVFIDGRRVSDRSALSDSVSGGSEVHVMQALSGG